MVLIGKGGAARGVPRSPMAWWLNRAMTLAWRAVKQALARRSDFTWLLDVRHQLGTKTTLGLPAGPGVTDKRIQKSHPAPPGGSFAAWRGDCVDCVTKMFQRCNGLEAVG
jgi:hypothetical protein